MLGMSKALLIRVVVVLCVMVEARPKLKLDKTKHLQNFLNGIKGHGGKAAEELERVHEKILKIHERERGLRNKGMSDEDKQKAEKFLELRKQDKGKGIEKDSISQLNEGLEEYLYEGDIKLTEEQADMILHHSRSPRDKRQAMKGTTSNKWSTTAPIPYYFDASISTATRALIRLTLQYWSNVTCLSFQENGSGANKLWFNKGAGCTSYIGRISSWSEQEVSIGDGCESFGTIAHEVGHALGFFHGQSRHDRENYITVNWQNIPTDWQDQYNKETTATNDNLGQEYDYGSVMHYAESFSSVGSPPHMLAKQSIYQRTMGSNTAPSFLDVMMINKLYGCVNLCTTGATCQNGGYRTPKSCSTCQCPWGFGGSDCSQRASPQNGASNCGATLSATTTFQTLTGQVGVNDNVEKSLMAACHWHITSPPGTVIEIKMVSTQGSCGQGCPVGFTEVKSKSYTLTGSRFCCPSDVSAIPSLTTTTNLAIISAHSNYNIQKFNIQYRYIGGSGTTPTSGTTTKSITTTKATITTTPSPSGSCSDMDENCSYYNGEGYCDTSSIYYPWMTENCAQTCNTCPSGTCEDVDTDCEYWASLGDCDPNADYYDWMGEYCASTCGLC